MLPGHTPGVPWEESQPFSPSDLRSGRIVVAVQGVVLWDPHPSIEEEEVVSMDQQQAEAEGRGYDVLELFGARAAVVLLGMGGMRFYGH